MSPVAHKNRSENGLRQAPKIEDGQQQIRAMGKFETLPGSSRLIGAARAGRVLEMKLAST